jgi:hypothetical protein
MWAKKVSLLLCPDNDPPSVLDSLFCTDYCYVWTTTSLFRYLIHFYSTYRNGGTLGPTDRLPLSPYS